MSHGTKELARIGDDFVGGDTLDLTDKSDTARVSILLVHIEALICGECAGPRIGVALYLVEARGIDVLMARVREELVWGIRMESSGHLTCGRLPYVF
jgi:hypothetical protein